MAHFKEHALNSTEDHSPGTNGTLVGTESNALVEKAFGTSAAADLIVQRKNDGNITVPTTPSSPTDAASKGYVDDKVTAGVTWKEIVLVPEQLINGGSGGIAQAILLALAANLQAGDTLVLTDGVNTETFTAVAGVPAANQFQVGGSTSVTLQNLVNSINANSAFWSAQYTTGLDSYFAGSLDPQAVIYKDAPSNTNDRLYGTIANGQADVKVVAFNSGNDYSQNSAVETDLPSADPGAKRFGFYRLFASLIVGETHRVANDSTGYTWDGDDQIWQQTSSTQTFTAGDGIDITTGKVSADTVTPAGASTQQYGAIDKRRTADGTGIAAADQGFLAVKTDNVDLAVDQATNSLKIKPQSRLDRFRGFGSWASTSSGDREPTLAELQATLGTTAQDIGNWCFMVESVGTFRTSTFIAYKKANAGVLADYHLVEMS